MIELHLDKLKLINAQLAEGTVGIDDLNYQNQSAWDITGGYLLGVSPAHTGSLTSITEKRALDWIARQLPPGSLVVEVGAFQGGSAAILAHANPLIQVKSIDIFDTELDQDRTAMQSAYANNYQQVIEQFLGTGARRTRDQVAAKLSALTNLEFVEGVSPQDFQATTWHDIDLYFEDAYHYNPELRRNLDFWCPKVKSGGIVVLHDYRPWLPQRFTQPLEANTSRWRWVDVESEVDRLQTLGYQLLGTVSGMAILRKP